MMICLCKNWVLHHNRLEPSFKIRKRKYSETLNEGESNEEKIKEPKFTETLFYLLPKEILIEIFEFLPLFDQSLLPI